MTTRKRAFNAVPGPDTARAYIMRLIPTHRAAVLHRLRTIQEALDGATGARQDPIEALDARLQHAAPADLWLATSVLNAALPTAVEMEAILRTFRLDGPWAALAPMIVAAAHQSPKVHVRVSVGAVTCDIHETASSDYVSGIQRVVRAAVVRWAQHHEVEFVGWCSGDTALRPLPSASYQRIFGHDGRPRSSPEVVVPWRGTHLVPELVIDPDRTQRLLALAKYSGLRVGYIGYDCIPLTTPAAVAPGMSSVFVRNLAAVRHASAVAAISPASAVEYSGWRAMLGGTGIPGPTVTAITLPVTAEEPNEVTMATARVKLGLTSAPMVFVVGSHEPRKNHLAVLHAAELLWREGHRFTLTIVGAGSWGAEQYNDTVRRMIEAGRPIMSIRGLSDELLWAGYRLAHFTLFPSLNEGYGLPVAESLAAGTPVVTSDFGSTKDIVAPDGVPLGGLLVDPRDDHSILDAMRTMLTDRATYERLKAEASSHDLGTWDEYAEAVWTTLTGTGTADSVRDVASDEYAV